MVEFAKHKVDHMAHGRRYFTEVLSKPIKPAALHNSLLSVVDHRPRKVTPEPPEGMNYVKIATLSPALLEDVYQRMKDVVQLKDQLLAEKKSASGNAVEGAVQ